MLKRECYLQKIRPFIDKDIVKVLTGIRRSGKSVLLDLVRQELIEKGVALNQIIFINFESEKIPEIKTVDGTFSYLKRNMNAEKRTYLFLDEIQELSGWEKIINSFLIDYDVDIYITGSNARLLSGELATYLAGRYVEIKVYPFSYGEVLQIKKQTGVNADAKEVFRAYLQFGGMPFLYQAKLDEQTSLQYLRDIYDSIILKDIVSRNRVKDIELLRRIIAFLMANVGNSFSAASIVKYLKNEKRNISAETLYNYIEYCQSSCFAHMVQREDIIGKKLLRFQEKIYLTDHGIREAVYGNNERDISQLLENIVYMELLHRGYEVNIGKNYTREIDFVAKLGKDRIYVQVAYLLADESTVEREFSAFERIPDNYPKYVVSMDEFDRSRNGIIHMNIREFLLLDRM